VKIPSTTTFRPSGRTIAFGATLEITTGRRSLTVTATFGAALGSVTLGAAVEVTVWVVTMSATTFATTGRAVTFATALEVIAGRRGRALPIAATLAVAPGVAFAVWAWSALIGAGEFGAPIAFPTGTALGPIHLATHLGGAVGIGSDFLGPDYAANPDKAQSTQATREEYRRPDSVRFNDSFAAHLDILLTVWRAAWASRVSIPGEPAAFGPAIRPSSDRTVARRDNESSHGHITGL
jgi:hypothetical protein